MGFKLEKYAHNPILKANPANDWESLCVLNPAAWYEDNKFYLLYKCAGLRHSVRRVRHESI